ncbi:UDP-N-acetylmuramate dehydrogenase [bacterium]|nr:UDP-N-acetylmuramate dehydrogenase [bacterium]
MMRFAKLLTEDDFDIKNHTSFKIGGKISKIYFPESLDDIKDLPSKSVVIGNLSNTLVSSYGYSGEVFSTSKLDEIKLDGAKVIAGAGVKGPKLAQTVAEYGLSGLEFMIGFPGSVGGEVYMNAGANGQQISDTFLSAKVFDGNSIITLTKDKMDFSYRHSICQDKRYIVLEAEFELTQKNPDEIKRKMVENLEFRKMHQPSLALPNCGSVFKNPENNSAGKLLDECGVKELQIGGAKVWENHANFIINTGGATSTDVLKLMLEMKQRVKEKFGIELVPEIKFLGDNEDEVKLCEQLKIR